jgi:hypothetical protein
LVPQILGLFFLVFRRVGRGEAGSEINQQSLALIFLDWHPQMRRGEQHVRHQQHAQQPDGAAEPEQVFSRRARHEHHRQPRRNQHEGRTQIRFFQNKNKRQHHQPDGFPEIARQFQFLGRPA